MEKLLKIQSDQYNLLTARIQDNRRARHDFRQHLTVIRDCADRGDLASLKDYLNDYEKMFQPQEIRSYCKNYAINAILSFYAEQAEKNGITMQVSIQMDDPPVIPETEFCVLIGNLLENAVSSRSSGSMWSRPASPCFPSPPTIQAPEAQTGPGISFSPPSTQDTGSEQNPSA